MILFLRKVLNTYLIPSFLFNKVITDKNFIELLNSTIDRKTLSYQISRRLRRFVFFWPTIIDADSWIEGDFGKYRDPLHFKDLRPDIDILLLTKVLEFAKSKDSSVLDLGCNSGRHLEYLHNKGLRNLTGVDIMKSALLYFQERCPEAFRDSQIHHDFFQHFLRNTVDKKFEIVYSVGATIELVHPSFDIIGNICRVAQNYVVLLVQENSHSYPRFYVTEFIKNRFKLIHSLRPIGESNISLLVFKREDSN
jgi:SAM-dependent methyltransferase